MKKFRTLSVLLLLIIMILQMFGCSVQLPEPQEISSEDEALAMGFSAGHYNGELKVGEYTWLGVNLKIDYEYALKWSSANPEIATVDSSGRVDAVSPGKTTITASVKKASVTYDITVSKASKKTTSYSTAFSANESLLQQNLGVEGFANPYAILVNIETGCATVYTYNNYGIYSKPVRAMVCSVGKGDATTIASYTIDGKERWQYMDDGNSYQYYTEFSNSNGGFAFSSTPYESNAAATLITAEYNKLGTPCTSGNIWLCADDAKWVYDNCEKGTLVKIVGEEAKDPLGVPVPMRISENAKYKQWDPTDSAEKNPYDKLVPTFEGVDEAYVIVNETFDAYEGVKVYDTCKNEFTEGVKVEGTVNCGRAGTYVITYLYTDAMSRTGRADRIVHVLPYDDYAKIMENAPQQTQ